MNAVLIYLTPIIAFAFFFNLVKIAHDVKEGEKEVTIQVLLGGFMFAFIVFALILSGISN